MEEGRTRSAKKGAMTILHSPDLPSRKRLDVWAGRQDQKREDLVTEMPTQLWTGLDWTSPGSSMHRQAGCGNQGVSHHSMGPVWNATSRAQDQKLGFRPKLCEASRSGRIIPLLFPDPGHGRAPPAQRRKGRHLDFLGLFSCKTPCPPGESNAARPRMRVGEIARLHARPSPRSQDLGEKAPPLQAMRHLRRWPLTVAWLSRPKRPRSVEAGVVRSSRRIWQRQGVHRPRGKRWAAGEPPWMCKLRLASDWLTGLARTWNSWKCPCPYHGYSSGLTCAGCHG
jgi:hypothetical protein